MELLEETEYILCHFKKGEVPHHERYATYWGIEHWQELHFYWYSGPRKPGELYLPTLEVEFSPCLGYEFGCGK